MASNRMPGKTLGLEINGMYVACETSCEFLFDCEMLPASAVTSGGWKEVIDGLKSWSINVNAAMLISMATGASIDTVLNSFINGTVMNIRFMVKDSTLPAFIIAGDVRVANGGISALSNANATWNTSLVGTGPFIATMESSVSVLDTGEGKIFDTGEGDLLQTE